MEGQFRSPDCGSGGFAKYFGTWYKLDGRRQISRKLASYDREPVFPYT